MENLQTIAQFEELKKGERTLFVFSADWCGDCRFIDPIMPEIEEKYNTFNFVKIDRDQFIDQCIELDVFGIPSFVAFHEGNEVGRFVSKDRKTQQEIEAFIEGLTI